MSNAKVAECRKKGRTRSTGGNRPAERRTRGVPGEARGVGKSRLETGEEDGAINAGGLANVGEGIKVRLPVERATMETYLGLYVKSILAIQETKEVVRKSGVKIDIPLAIMTSEDTHDMTVDLLESNNYFGAKKTQITLMKQEKVPCLVDNDAHLATKDDDKYVLQTKPHGHGDVHALLHQSGLLKRWKSMGVKWVTFFQDTNSLVFRVISGALGVSYSRDFDFNSS